ncbi:hypothetical protein NP493_669g01058 [Ridgeia piscesae]|uniref:Ubiquitin-like domain-containing protein n=1 Tax=Ridgeia piscesae TaxID=27915 RepID=A0AAD9NN86_RIDPI|nr:hypothetical protein NP493_669g01058 [Ridgeia piscesae]
MAADGVDRLKVVLVHGQRKLNISLLLPHSEVGDCLTVGHLAREVEKVTQVFIRHQKLFFNGKLMCNPSDVLSQLGIKQGSKIMLVGRPNVIDETPGERTVRVIGKRTIDLGKDFSKFIHELDGVSSKKKKLVDSEGDDDDDEDDPDYIPSSSESTESTASHKSDPESVLWSQGVLRPPGRFRGMDRLKVGLEWFTREFTDMWKTVSMLEDNEMTEVSTRKHMIIARLERLLDQCDKMKYGISSAIVLLDCNVMMLGERLKHD